MNITEAIRNRRSIRSFKTDPVPKEVLEEIMMVIVAVLPVFVLFII